MSDSWYSQVRGKFLEWRWTVESRVCYVWTCYPWMDYWVCLMYIILGIGFHSSSNMSKICQKFPESNIGHPMPFSLSIAGPHVHIGCSIHGNGSWYFFLREFHFTSFYFFLFFCRAVKRLVHIPSPACLFSFMDQNIVIGLSFEGVHRWFRSL